MECLHRIHLPDRGAVPCGRCVNCRKNKRQSWVYRLQAEADECPFSLFVTLTYDDEHIPTAMIGEDLFKTTVGVVSKRDIQLFMKRLRKKYDQYRLRYFLTSEYGSQGGRPHYHMILFGFPLLVSMVAIFSPSVGRMALCRLIRSLRKRSLTLRSTCMRKV